MYGQEKSVILVRLSLLLIAIPVQFIYVIPIQIFDCNSFNLCVGE